MIKELWKPLVNGVQQGPSLYCASLLYEFPRGKVRVQSAPDVFDHISLFLLLEPFKENSILYETL